VDDHTSGYSVAKVWGRNPQPVGLAHSADEDPMSSTVPCPECHQPAHVLDSFIEERASGPVRYLRLQCDGPLSFLVTVDDVDDETPAMQAALDVHDGAA
jgi:hypothetical protein